MKKIGTYRFLLALELFIFFLLTTISLAFFAYEEYSPMFNLVKQEKPITNPGGTFGAAFAYYAFSVLGFGSVLVPFLLLVWAFYTIKDNYIKAARLSFTLIGFYLDIFTFLALFGNKTKYICGTLPTSLASILLSFLPLFLPHIILIIIFLIMIWLAFRFNTIKFILELISKIKEIEQKRKAKKEAEKIRILEEFRRKEEERLKQLEKIRLSGDIHPGTIIELPVNTKSDRTTNEYIENRVQRQRAFSDSSGGISEPTPESEPEISNIQEEIYIPSDEDKKKITLPVDITKEKSEPQKGVEKPIYDYPQPVPIGLKYEPPPITLLNFERQSRQIEESEYRLLGQLLLEKLASFNIEGELKSILPGPVITRFEFEPAAGIKVSQILNLEDDLALALKAPEVRIQAPVPGKGVVGIEVPRKNPERVYIREIIESDQFKRSLSPLTIALGKKVDGSPYVTDIRKLPHLLIAGSTGSGKSVGINAMITSIIYKATPESVQLILIDPKRIELTPYNGIPFLRAPVIVEPKDAASILKFTLIVMNRRYKLLEEKGVREIDEYNRIINPTEERRLPYIVIIIDELADLMMVAGKDVEEPIVRLAQLARAVGIHLIVATQRPSVDVVTGLIKANFPARIAFRVRSKVDSRTILDTNGAERLIGQGDMLFLPPGTSTPIRIHGCFISTEETQKIVQHIKGFENPYGDEFIELDEVTMGTAETPSELDELFWDAARIVVGYRQSSTSYLQRRLRIGYTRAARLMEQMESLGIVGPLEGSKPREILIQSLEKLEELRAQLEGK